MKKQNNLRIIRGIRQNTNAHTNIPVNNSLKTISIYIIIKKLPYGLR